jgi:hypothetical protein
MSLFNMIALVRYGFLGYAEASVALSLFFLTVAMPPCSQKLCGCSRRGTGCGLEEASQ